MRNVSAFFVIFAVCVLISATLGSSVIVNAVEPYKTVEISIKTSSNIPDYFTVNAYNISGSLVASYQTQVPAASFQLLTGQYIFTVAASTETNQVYPVPLSGTVAPETAQSPNAILTQPSRPIYFSPVLEYGYITQQVTASTAFVISTTNVTSFPTNTLSIKVQYINGTAAKDTSVTASVLGGVYYWGYQNDVTLWATTGPDGVAKLTTPRAPVQVDAWNWIPVNLQKSQTTVQVNIGGEIVDVTVYWQPSYVGLAGSVLIIPPQDSSSITLKVQQPNYWVLPYGSTGSAAPPIYGEGSSTASSPGSIPSSVVTQQQGNPFLQNYQSPVTPTSITPSPITTQTPQPTPSPTISAGVGTIEIILTIAIVAIIVAILSLLVAFRIQRQKR